MQYRQLPPVGTLDDIETVWRAVPQTPDETEDCCQRLCDRTAIDSRSHASQWLVFLSALECVSDDGGYYRHEALPDDATLATAFESSIFGVEAVLGVAGQEPQTSTDIEKSLPETTCKRIERTEHSETYLDRLLGWAATFGYVEQTADGYRKP
jgi:hypothetical protein